MVGFGGGSFRSGQLQLLVHSDDSAAAAEPIVGNEVGTMFKAMHAFLDRKILSVDDVKYTSWRVVCVSPFGDFPDIRTGSAPSI